MSLRKMFQWLCGLLLGLSAAAVVALFLLAAKPEWFATSARVEEAIGVLGRSFQPRWKDFAFGIHSISLKEKEISIQAHGLCFEAPDANSGGCFKSVEILFSLRFGIAGANVKIAKFNIQGDRLRVNFVGKPVRNEQRTARFWPPKLPRGVKSIAVEKLRIDLPSIGIVKEGWNANARAFLLFDISKKRPVTLAIQWRQRSGKKISAYRAHMSVASDFFRTGDPDRFDAVGDFKGGKTSILFRAETRRARHGAVSLRTRASGVVGNWRIEEDMGGVEAKTSYALAGFLNLESTGPVKTVKLDHLAVTARPDASGRPDRLRMTSDVQVAIAFPAMNKGVMGRMGLPNIIRGTLAAHANMSPVIGRKGLFEADASLNLVPHKGWYDIQGGIYTRASGKTNDIRSLRLRDSLNIALNISEFQSLVALLSGSDYAVPAPFDVLRGPLRLEVSSAGDALRERQDVHYRFVSGLHEARQRLNVQASGTVELFRMLTSSRSVLAESDVALQDVALQLPHIEATKVPSVKLDPRIITAKQISDRKKITQVKKPEMFASTSAVKIDFHVDTPKPLLLYSNLAKTPVPVKLDLRLQNTPGALEGSIVTQPFWAEAFRRVVLVDHVRLIRHDDSKIMDIDALIVYKVSEATIRIRLLGSSEKPQVQLESDPPLSQPDIIALLLYGKSPDELDPDEQSTVANTQTAVADKAFGLASLYLFASTPIEFVGYDPVSRAYTMKFKLPGGATVEIGSDFDESKTVQLRRRIAPHFAIQAQARSPSQTTGGGVTTFLEWFTRY